MGLCRHPDDQAPTRRPKARRDPETAAVIRLYPITYGDHEAVLVENEHPGTKEVKLSLAPKRRPR